MNQRELERPALRTDADEGGPPEARVHDAHSKYIGERQGSLLKSFEVLVVVVDDNVFQLP